MLHQSDIGSVSLQLTCMIDALQACRSTRLSVAAAWASSRSMLQALTDGCCRLMQRAQRSTACLQEQISL
jgi:hypothetical protein